jgi:hypothetical protein
MEKCTDGKVVANHVFPISSVMVLYLLKKKVMAMLPN